METDHAVPRTAGQPVTDRMRELLARTARDQVYEQRSHGQVLDEFRQRLEGMEWLLREVRDRELAALAAQIEDGIGRVDEAAQRVTDLARRLDRLQGGMEASSVRFNRLDKALAEQGHRNDRLEHAVGEVSARVDRSLGDLAGRVEKGLDAVAGRMEGVAGRLDGLDGRLAGLTGRLDGVDGRFTGLEATVRTAGDHAEVVQRLAALEEMMITLAEALLRPRHDGGE
ncbi:Chromosome partition protein Smc [Actinomadura rubteroloni]|uniref:Chromosome partition protein Smc n=1 Tax=Actinomadura rubteroloni TaxID=1926885 RepID=A0A2P4UJV5_9ACTN|nr:hypothetical protein [Actinomadura rubteroloni]POM25330.1 Chromosome partition protein Smc [Actinomadura rubteroloni]